MMRTTASFALLAVLAVSPAVSAQTSSDASAGSVRQEVPQDLRPLLTPKPSELRLVLPYYRTDRVTLSSNYPIGRPRSAWGGGWRQVGRTDQAGPAPVPPVSMSVHRIARLRRFDMEWREALSALDTTDFSEAGRADVRALRDTISANLARLEDEARGLTEVAPLVPFALAIVHLAEARIRVERVDGMEVGGNLTRITRQVADMRGRLETGLHDAQAPDAITLSPGLAQRTAATVRGLQRDLADWFRFYHLYDPLFTWWAELPYAHADSALAAYAELLSGPVASAGASTRGVAAVGTPEIAPADPPDYSSVPDLEELTALPHDEMAEIVRRFRDLPEGANRRRRTGMIVAEHDGRYYRDWLTALESLDFDALSRNAQVDYLFIKHVARTRLEREGVTLPAHPPRKTDDSGIGGDARGREGLIRDLDDAFISYTPEQLIALGKKEFAYTVAELKKASREMGYGDDWKAALEKVKTMTPPPGEQPYVVDSLLDQAVDYLRGNDLLTVPQVAAESMHMIMMSPERQLVNPFFTGGSEISVSYPTNTMEYEARIQSMRGNNTPMAHATAFHEMIPGHNLDGYMRTRFDGYRADLVGSTPFYGEGWALYWELVLYRSGFDGTPEERIGALFWRLHRCARIIFSLEFHMGEWSPQEAIDFLVDSVGHERDNATAEVRRSFQEGSYGPLYQAAYLLGGLQLLDLRDELVGSGKMSDRQFNDEVIRLGDMPIALLRLVVGDQKLTPDTSLDWAFYGEISVDEISME